MASLDKFLDTPPGDLISDLSDLRRQKTDIANRERVIMQLLEMIVERGGSTAEEVFSLAAESAVAIGPLRDQIRQVFASKQADDEYFLPPLAAHQALVARGNETATLDHVRTIMKRMTDTGELLQPRSDTLLFALPNVINNAAAMALFNAAMGEE
jgi:hypothetical protein